MTHTCDIMLMVNEATIGGGQQHVLWLAQEFNARVTGERLPFEDDSFEKVIVLELLEHVLEPLSLLKEVGRVVSTNVLTSTRHCEGVKELRRAGFLYEHFADLDHRNFFTSASLEVLLRPDFCSVLISRSDIITPLAAAQYVFMRKCAGLLLRFGFVAARYAFRLYAVWRP